MYRLYFAKQSSNPGSPTKTIFIWRSFFLLCLRATWLVAHLVRLQHLTPRHQCKHRAKESNARQPRLSTTHIARTHQSLLCCATWFSLEGGWADMMFSSWRWVKWAKWVRWVKWVPKVKCRCCCRTPLQKHLTHLTHKLLHLSQTALISLYKNSPCEWTRRDYCVNLEVITNNVICMVWPSIGSFISCYWVVWDIDC